MSIKKRFRRLHHLKLLNLNLETCALSCLRKEPKDCPANSNLLDFAQEVPLRICLELHPPPPTTLEEAITDRTVSSQWARVIERVGLGISLV